jgi:inhibitor of cysteine peptidase
MKCLIRFTLCSVAVIFLATCSSESKQSTSKAPMPVEINTPTGQLSIEDVKIQILESFPVQVMVIVSGTLPKKCQVLSVDIAQENRTFFITLKTTEQASGCLSTDNTFIETIPLNVDGLKAGIYQVNIQGLIEQFELAVDNIVHW